MPRAAGVHRNRCRMLAGDFQHDGQTQTRPVHAGPERAVKRPENQFTFGLRNTGSGVLNLQNHGPAERVYQQAGGNYARHFLRGWRVVDGVIHEVGNHLPQQRGIAPYDGARRAGIGTFIAHIQKLQQGARRAVVHHVHCNLGQVTGFVLKYHATALCAGQ